VGLAIIKLFFIFVENLKNYGPSVPNELGKNNQSEIWAINGRKNLAYKGKCNCVMW
jgi:hypothetical protein